MVKGEVCLGVGQLLAAGQWVADANFPIYQYEQVHTWLLRLRGDLTSQLMLEAPTGTRDPISSDPIIDQAGRYVVAVTPMTV